MLKTVLLIVVVVALCISSFVAETDVDGCGWFQHTVYIRTTTSLLVVQLVVPKFGVRVGVGSLSSYSSLNIKLKKNIYTIIINYKKCIYYFGMTLNTHKILSE